MGRDTPQEFSSTRTLMLPSRPMHSITQRLLAFGLLLACTTSSFAQGSEEDIQKILREGKDQSRVMETLEYLSEEIGARLTGSSAKMEANVWDDAAMEDWREDGVVSWSRRPGRQGEGPVAFAMEVPDTPGFQAEILRGRFDQVDVADLGKRGGHVWILRSARGTFRLTMGLEEQQPTAASRWPETIPGLIESLHDEPIACEADPS